MLTCRSSVPTRCLIEATALAKPSFGHQENDGQDDEQEAQNTGGLWSYRLVICW